LKMARETDAKVSGSTSTQEHAGAAKPKGPGR
jgi:hypothetical protein